MTTDAIRIEAVPAEKPVDDLAVLREHSAAEARVVAEHQADNVAVTVCAGAEIRMIAAIANDMEANGDSPDIHFFRDERGIRGLVLTGRLSRETTAGLRYEPVTP